jgi:tetratricopeptide (TPR) repeat protein
LPESLAEAQLARQIDPEVKINSSAINSYLYLGEYEKFLQSLPVNDSAYILFYRGFGEYYLNRRDQAQQDFDHAYDRDPSSLPAIIGKAFSYSLQRENERGLELLKQTEARINQRGVADPEGLYKVAQAYAVLGDKASALRVLRQSIEGGFFCYPYFERDPLLRDLRGNGEFQTLMKQALDRHEQFKTTFF